MRKIIVLVSAMVALMISVAVVSAQEISIPADSSLPASIASYISEDISRCPELGKKNGVQDVSNIDTGWGNSNSLNVKKGTWKVAGTSVSGSCQVPLSVVDAQTIMDSLCRPGQVNTSRNNWGNASRTFDEHKKGELRISGKGVGGQCWLSGDAADIAYSLIPKFNK